MTSQINPNNIDGNYPIAGVSNNTQGLRDNFTNIKQNFQYAENEIDDLQNNVLLKAALIGTTLDNNLGNNLIYNAQIRGFSGTLVQIANTSGSITVDCSAGHLQTIAMAGNISVSFTTNTWPAAGLVGLIRLKIIVDTAGRTMTLPSAVGLGTTGIQGYSANVITFATAGTFEFGFLTYDQGTTITLFDLNRPLSYYTNDVTIAANTVSTSTTSGALTVAGGIGVAGNLYVGNINSGGVISSTGNVLTSAGNVLVTGGTGGVGYTAGAGGTVSQSTNKATGVTLNKQSGTITMQATTLNAATIVNFVLTNSTIGTNDLLLLQHQSSGTLGSYTLNAACTAGSAIISVRNGTAGSLSEVLVLRYAVIKGAVA